MHKYVVLKKGSTYYTELHQEHLEMQILVLW